MNILVLNCGSSSLKYRLIAMPGEKELAGGEAQRVGPPTAEPARIHHRVAGTEQVITVGMPDHAAAFDEVIRLLAESGGLAPDVLGHRLVHGGDRFCGSTIIDDDMERLHAVKDMAPLHNPPAIGLIEACKRRYPDLPQVAVFDTAFHSTIPSYASTYALPKTVRRDLEIRKYGFHGTSHQYVVAEAAKHLGKPLEQLNAVSCHLGSGGASLCAIVRGRSVDNTMGYSPLQGLVMSTRCGDLDPAVTLQLLHDHVTDIDAVEKVLNQKSGILSLSGTSADIRDVFAGMSVGGKDQERLREIASLYLWRIRKYLGAYLATVGKPDAVIFTDTIGETMPAVRYALCADMWWFGLQLDPQRNTSPGKLPADISADNSPVRILVIQTNEELAIARQTYDLLQTSTNISVRI
ncbi:MAG: acetate/propionate family kinase [Phycisphaerae bacterium]|nr:acetate/propionate family kinase [Phycisphaerae bacterium]